MANQTRRLTGSAAAPAGAPATPAPGASADGQIIIDRYRLLQTVGQGGFGTVYLALDTWLQRRVAIKRIPLSAAETDITAIKEARTEAMLKGPNIVLLWDFQLDGSDALLIMEHIDGPTLSELLRESRELLDLGTIAAIAECIAAALQLAHQNQVLHLDIKPDNILIDHEGQVKVADFGLAQLSGISGFAKARGGTIGYMPPEQLQQLEIDCRSDLWAFATLLYQLLTGFNPFQASSINESLQRILNDPLPLPSELRDDLSPDADTVIVQALMAAKEQRQDSVSEFIGQLLPLLGKPKKGHKQLKLLVNNSDLDEI